MIEYYKELEQNTPDWYKARLGVVTASQVKTLFTTKLKLSKDQKIKAYAFELATQRETQHIEDNFQSWDMKRGHIEEEYARNLYENEVQECGFITNDFLGFTIGFSPDGLVGDDGLIEIKSIKNKHQVKTFYNDVVPDEYMLQMQTGLLVSERKWCDFISYSNGMPLFVKRVFPDIELQELIKIAISDFELTVKEIHEKYKSSSKGLMKADRIDHSENEKHDNIAQDF